MEFKDYYQTLGVAREATADEIKKAFRRLARKYHPDVSKEPNAEARMKDVNEAHAVLSDPEKRAAYDQLGRDYQEPRLVLLREYRVPLGEYNYAFPAGLVEHGETPEAVARRELRGAARAIRCAEDHHARS